MSVWKDLLHHTVLILLCHSLTADIIDNLDLNFTKQDNEKPNIKKIMTWSGYFDQIPKKNFGQFQRKINYLNSFYSSIKPPAVVHHAPRRMIVEPGSNVTLFCQWSGHPRPNITWHRGVLLSDTDDLTEDIDAGVEGGLGEGQMVRGRIFSDRSKKISELIIPRVDHRDADNYACLVRNLQGSAHATMTLLVKGSIFIIESPKNQSIMEYSRSVVFACKATGEPDVVKYDWYKGSVHVNLIESLKHRAQITKEGSLIIATVQRQDRGWYTCKPSNGRQPQQQQEEDQPTTKAFLDVLFKVTALMPDVGSVYLPVGGVGRVPCDMSGSPMVYTVQWKKEGHAFPVDIANVADDNHQKITHFGNVVDNQIVATKSSSALLRFNYKNDSITARFWHKWEPVTWFDSGLYRCRGRSELDWGNWSNTIQIIVKEYPKFTVKPKPIYWFNETDIGKRNIILPCRAAGDPKPIIKWSRTSHQPLSQVYDSDSLDEMNENAKAGFQRNVGSGTTLGVYEHSRSIPHQWMLNLSGDGADLETEMLSLPKGASVDANGNLHLKRPRSIDLNGVYHCVATNEIARLITSTKVYLNRHSHRRSRVENKEYHPRIRVEPQLFGVYLDWSSTDETLFHTENIKKKGDQTEYERQCFFTLYFKTVRSEEKWSSIRVQPDSAQQLWLAGLIPAEMYAFSVRRWCGLHSASSFAPAVHMKTLALSAAAYFSGDTFSFSAEQPNTSSTRTRADGTLLELYPPWLDHLGKQLQPPRGVMLNYSSNQVEDIAAPIYLTWRPPEFPTPVLYYQVEFATARPQDTQRPPAHFQTNTVVVEEGVASSSSSQAHGRWRTFGPVRSDITTLVLASQEEWAQKHGRFKNQPDEADHTITFRVRAYGLQSMSEPSEEYSIAAPFAQFILPALKIRVHVEKSRIERSLKIASRQQKKLLANNDHLMYDGTTASENESQNFKNGTGSFLNLPFDGNLLQRIESWWILVIWFLIGILLIVILVVSTVLITFKRCGCRKVTVSRTRSQKDNPTKYQTNPLVEEMTLTPAQKHDIQLAEQSRFNLASPQLSTYFDTRHRLGGGSSYNYVTFNGDQQDGEQRKPLNNYAMLPTIIDGKKDESFQSTLVKLAKAQKSANEATGPHISDELCSNCFEFCSSDDLKNYSEGKNETRTENTSSYITLHKVTNLVNQASLRRSNVSGEVMHGLSTPSHQLPFKYASQQQAIPSTLMWSTGIPVVGRDQADIANSPVDDLLDQPTPSNLHSTTHPLGNTDKSNATLMLATFYQPDDNEQPHQLIPLKELVAPIATASSHTLSDAAQVSSDDPTNLKLADLKQTVDIV